MMRVFLFLVTNIAILLLLSVMISIFGVGHHIDEAGLNVAALLIFSAILGFGGSFISLLISKPIAKWSTGSKVIDGTEGTREKWLVDTVEKLSYKAGITPPEVAIYRGDANAFATGAFKNSALVAVSTGLLGSMNDEEVEAVLGHEIAHVTNGDMVTLSLIQGVVNTFVIFLARVIGYVVDKAVLKSKRDTGIGYYLTVFVCQIIFSILASMIVAWFSRRREYRADADSARLLENPQPMINALARLGGITSGALPESIASAGITNRRSWMSLFSTHPPIEDRIAKLNR